MKDCLYVKGAREHNLKNVDLEIPKNSLVVFTGVSGSGKSSLAFDTIFAEGQRRYIESLSSYARQFLGQMEKPHYDYIRGLSPTISIEQKAASKNPRSTVGTVTEIYDYLRVLYARIGKQHCHCCGEPVGRQSTDQMVDHILTWPEGTKLMLLSPQVLNRKGEHKEVFQDALKSGFTRVRVNGDVMMLEDDIKLEEKRKHNIEIVVDRLVLKDGIRSRLTDSIESALSHSDGVVIIHRLDEKRDVIFSENLACAQCNISFPELSPQSFSFNSPVGMCVECNGLGTRMEVDPASFIQSEKLSISEGAVIPWANAMKRKEGWSYNYVSTVLAMAGINPDIPFSSLTKEQQEYIFYGNRKRSRGGMGSGAFDFKGLVKSYETRFREQAENEHSLRDSLTKYMRDVPCSACGGSRLRPESSAVKISGESISALCSLTVKKALEFLNHLKLDNNETIISGEILKELKARLGFLLSVGLEYLTLNRLAPSLSGGESQRIRLASQIGSELTGVLYILDEPSIGLHQKDNDRLIATLKHLRDIGNSVLVVEHDEDMILNSDHVVDFGPGAGVLGGEVVHSGGVKELFKNKKSLTGLYMSGKKQILPELARVSPGEKWLEILGACENNLKDVSVKFPSGCLTVVTGVSGAGKSTLINSILWPAAQNHFNRASGKVGAHERILGFEHFDSVIDINQQPIGRTPRSNPATYVKVFDQIRDFFSKLEESKVYGFKPGRFSFNVKGGRCETCQGAGLIKVEMHFLADVYVPCDDCKGKRFNQATLRVKYRGKNIAEVLEMSVNEASDFFKNVPNIHRILVTLQDVGLGYIKLGQAATTLSGGEAQRVKLSRELAKRSTGKTLYLLDEPTTGLHFDDIHRLLIVIRRLVDAGNTVIIIEHNLDVIRCADYIVDLGPEGGEAGGTILYQGPVPDIVNNSASYTGRYLKPLLEKMEKKGAGCG